MFGYNKTTVKGASLLALVALALGLFVGNGGVAGAQGQGPYAINSLVAARVATHLLDQPAAGSAIVTQMPLNAQALVLGGPFNDGWYWLDYSGARGYASVQVLVLVDQNYTPVPTETPTSQPTIALPTAVPPAPNTATPKPVPPTATPKPIPPTATTKSLPATATQKPATPTVTPVPPTTVVAVTATVTASPAVTSTFTVPTTPGDYTGLWLAEMATGGNVRVGPGLDQKIMKTWGTGRRVLLYQGVLDSKNNLWYRVSEAPEAPMWVHSSLIKRVEPVVFEPARYKGRWVNVNLAQQIVTGYENGKPVMVTLASTGKTEHPTIPGVWKIYWRLPKQEMKNGNLASPDYYDLKDVPFPQYFHISGEALHGTYWHDDFGHPHSHGCVNLSTPISEWFYNWDNIGTIVYVH